MNPELICPPYILWTRHVRAGSDPSSPNPQPVVVRSQLSSHEQHPSSHNPVPIVGCCVPVIARFFLNFHTRRRALRTHCRDPSRARPPPVRASLISTRAFSHFSALCQSIPACTCHGDCLRDSPQGANYISLHVIHHH